MLMLILDGGFARLVVGVGVVVSAGVEDFDPRGLMTGEAFLKS